MCKEIYNERIMKFDYGDYESYNFSIRINGEEHGFLTPTSTINGCLDYFNEKRDVEQGTQAQYICFSGISEILQR